MDMNNKVVRVVTKEHGEKVLSFFKHKGVKIGNRTVECWEENGDKGIYYGVVKGIFDNYRFDDLTQFVDVIHLPEEELVVSDKESFFENVVDETLTELKSLILVKGKEYRRNNNPYHNFERGAGLSESTPFQVLDGFRLKHRISQKDIINDVLHFGIAADPKVIHEKWNDDLVYTIIEKAMLLSEL